MTTVVSVHDLTKTYGSGGLAVDAVRHVDLDIGTGEVVLVMGPSGSGKTTLLLMLGAMLRPTSGSVHVDGTDVASTPERSLPPLRARRFGFAMATDPVCGMAVETGDGLHADHDGTTFWFCSPYCRDEFIANPTRFLAGEPGMPRQRSGAPEQTGEHRRDHSEPRTRAERRPE